MKEFVSSLLLCFCLAAPAISSAADAPLNNDEIRVVLGHVTKQANTLGLLKFCQKEGLAKAVGGELMGGVMLSIDEPQPELHQAKSIQAFRAAELYADGVAAGLRLSQMDAGLKDGACSLASDMANEILSQSPVSKP